MSGNLQLNKIMGAVLGTGLLIMGVKIGAELMFETHPPKTMGYAVEVQEAATAGEGETVELMPDWGTVMPTVPMADGEAVFKKCLSCHNITQGGAHGTGPNLWAIVGRPVGGASGFAYSDAMKAHAAEEPVWSYDALYNFLKNPAKVVKGTKMSFAGVKKYEERVALIAYMHAQGSAGYAMPAPDPSRQPGAATAAAEPAPADGTATSTAALASASTTASVAPKAEPSAPVKPKPAATSVSASKTAAPAPAM